MRNWYRLVLLIIVLFTWGCKDEIESVPLDRGLDFNPLALGNTWIYEVEETRYFGENDFEFSRFFYQDRIRTSYLDAERQIVFIVERSKSFNKKDWSKQLDYTIQIRNNSLVRTINNRPIIVFSFPPSLGKKWNGNAFLAAGKDEFEIDSVATQGSGANNELVLVRVNQQKLDDKVTQRDNRYELFNRSVGLIEKYDEVLTYCSRNDCLGKQLIDGGYREKIKLVEHAVR